MVLLLLAELVAPAVVVLDFLVERDRIAKEICVQRLTPESMRTCHGQCYVMKKLRSVEQQERDLPDCLRAMRMDDAMPLEMRSISGQQFGASLRWPTHDTRTLPGSVPSPEHVPWG